MSRRESKEQTAIGNNVDSTFSSSANQAQPLRTKSTTGTRNPHYQGETDSETPLMGSMDGVSQVNSTNLDQTYGYISASGSSMLMEDAPGGETLHMTHHSGATVRIDPDGAVYLTSSGAKGIGISAPFGDAYVDAAGDVSIKGSSLSFMTSGDANFDIGGTFNLNAAAYKLSTNVMDETIDGSVSRSVTNDVSEVIGGIERSTVAGDRMKQTTGNDITHVGGDKSTFVAGDNSDNITGDQTIAATGNALYTSEGTQYLLSEGNAALSSQDSIDIVATNTLNADSLEAHIRAAHTASISAATSVTVASNATVVSGTSSVEITGGGTAKMSAPASSVHGGSVTIGTGTLIAPEPSGSPSASISAPSSIEGPDGAYTVEAPEEAMIVPANDIIDTLTSARKYPDFPGNAQRMSADAGSVYTVAHDQSNSAEEAYNEYSSKNYGNSNPVSRDDYGTIPEVSSGQRRDDIKAIDPSISVPSRGNSSSKISKFFTLGALINAKHSHNIPSGSYDAVVANHIFAAYNVLDPIKEKFPDLIITSAYRGNSPNHITGLAIDIVVSSRSLEVHAEIARFARDNLPVDQVMLERNTSGRTHVHVRATKGSGAPKVLTCGDPRCKGNTAGISVEYLRRKGVR